MSAHSTTPSPDPSSDPPQTFATLRLNVQVNLELAADLVTLLARAAMHIIETDDDAFSPVQGAPSHLGAPPRRIDMLLERKVQQWSRSHPHVYVESEEAAARSWARPESPPPIIRLDEFDGTTIARGTAGHWACSAVVFVWSKRRQRYVLAGSVIACHDGHLVCFTNHSKRNADGSTLPSGDVTIARFDTFADYDASSSLPPRRTEPAMVDEAEPRGDAGFIAVSGAAGLTRGKATLSEFAAIFTDFEMRTLQAGTPLIYGAIRGDLGAIIDPPPASIHDAAHLFPLAALGWQILDRHTWEPVDIFTLAEENCEPNPGAEKPIPAIAACSTVEITIRLRPASQDDPAA